MTKHFPNFSTCTICAGIIENGECSLCKSVEGANLKFVTVVTDVNRPVPFIGIAAMILAVAMIFGFFSYCANHDARSAPSAGAVKK